jgi:hypothetical protein
MTGHRHLLLTAVFLTAAFLSSAQEERTEDFKRHKVVLVLGHAMTPEGININGKKTLLFLPSWGLDYDYRLNEIWSIGLHSDIIIENFSFENSKQIIQERTTPLATIATVGYRLGKHLTAMVGAGAEFAKEENLAVLRVGADYGWELGENWEVAVNYMLDFKLDAYNTGVIGVGLVRNF